MKVIATKNIPKPVKPITKKAKKEKKK